MHFIPKLSKYMFWLFHTILYLNLNIMISACLLVWCDKVRRLTTDPIVLRSSPAADIYTVHYLLTSPTRRTRSQSSDAPDRLVVPLYSGERSAGTSYSVAAPKLWNSLPANIRNSRSLDTFNKHLKTHYFKEHFYGI